MDDRAAGERPRLAFRAPEELGPGVFVREVALDRSSAPFKVSRFTVEPGRATPPDRHRVREMWMVAAGEGTLMYEGRQMRVRAGDVVFFDSDEEHVLRNDGPATLAVHSIWWAR